MNHAPQLNLAQLQERVQAALRQWHQENASPSPLAPLYLFQQLRQSEHIGEHFSEHETTNRVLYQGLQLLEERYPRDATLIRRTDLDKDLNDTVAIDLNIAPATLYRHKVRALTHLSELLLELEERMRGLYRSRMLARLAPPTSSHLLGVTAHLQHLTELLTTAGPPWIVALAGMGGIGKTTLADAVVRGLVMQGAGQGIAPENRPELGPEIGPEIGWVTARQMVLPWHGPLHEVAEPALSLEALAEELCKQLLDERIAPSPSNPRNVVMLLRGLLKARPHLIVIDNLETVRDIEALVIALRDLAAPTKFLLTSRESLFTQPDIYHFAVPELTAADGLALIRHEAKARNMSALLHASDAELRPITEIVGGNPLALRLIVGQTYIHPLPVVLENLAKARGAQIENLYTYIYRHAWQRLDETSRRVLLAMPLVTAAGAELAQLVEISEIGEDKVIKALDELVKMNLVDVRGDLFQRRYAIHNLTRTFLHEQVLHWT